MAGQEGAWHSSGYLPHLDVPGAIQSITFGLMDSVPAALIEQWRDELDHEHDRRSLGRHDAVLRKRIELFADSGYGACWLRQPRIAAAVEEALLRFDGSRYQLLTWCVMPNHVHVLVETRNGHPLGRVVHSWKSFTAQPANRMLGRSGRFLGPDYFDRMIRDERHLSATISYIEYNPVKAGLCETPESWPWSSARRRADSAGRGLL